MADQHAPRLRRSWEHRMTARGPINLWCWLAEHEEFCGPMPEGISDADYDTWRRVIAERIDR